jgi:hypothetical protein
VREASTVEGQDDEDEDEVMAAVIMWLMTLLPNVKV